MCLKSAIKKIRRQSQRLIRGIDYDDLDYNTVQGNSPGSLRRPTFILKGEGKTFDALIDQLASMKRRKVEGRSRQSSITSNGLGALDRNVNDECTEAKPNVGNQGYVQFQAGGSNGTVARTSDTIGTETEKTIDKNSTQNKVLNNEVTPSTIKTECGKTAEDIITLPKKLGSVSHDCKDDDRDQRGVNYDEILLGNAQVIDVKNTAIVRVKEENHKEEEKEKISEAVRLGRISRGDSAIRFLARVSTLKSCNSIDEDSGADKSPPSNYGCSSSYSPMSVSSDTINDANSSGGNRPVGDFVYPDLQSRVRSLRLKSRSISPVSRSGGSPAIKLSSEDYLHMSQKKIGVIVDFNDFDDDDDKDEKDNDESSPESNEYGIQKRKEKEMEQSFNFHAREALTVSDYDIEESEDGLQLQYRFGNVTRNIRNSSHFANRDSIAINRGLNFGDTFLHNLKNTNNNVQNDLTDGDVDTRNNDFYSLQTNLMLRTSATNATDDGSFTMDKAHGHDQTDQDGDSVSDMLTNIRKASIGAASTPPRTTNNRRPASVRVTSDRIPPAAAVSRPKPHDHDQTDQDGDSVSDMLTNIRKAGIGAASTPPRTTNNRRPASMRVTSDRIPPAAAVSRPKEAEKSNLRDSMLSRTTDGGSFTTDEIYSVRDECHPYTNGRRAEITARDGSSRSSSVRLSIGRKASTESVGSIDRPIDRSIAGRKAFVSVVRHNSSSNINMYDTMSKSRRVSNTVQPPKSKAKEEQANLFNEYLTREFSSVRRAEFQNEMELMSSIMKEKMVQLNDSIQKVQMHNDEIMQGTRLSNFVNSPTDKFTRKSILEIDSDGMESNQMENPTNLNLNMDLIRMRMRSASIHTDPNTPMRKSSLQFDVDPNTPKRKSSLDSNTVDFMSNPMIARMRTASINTNNDSNTPKRKTSLDSNTVDFMSNPMIARMRTASINTNNDSNPPKRKSSLQTSADNQEVAVEYMNNPMSIRSKSIRTEPNTPLRKSSLQLDADSHAIEYMRNPVGNRSRSVHTDPNSPSIRKSIFQIDEAKDGDAITNIRNQIKLAFTPNLSAWRPLSPPAVTSRTMASQRDKERNSGNFVYTAHSDDDDKSDKNKELFPQTSLTSPPQTDHMRQYAHSNANSNGNAYGVAATQEKINSHTHSDNYQYNREDFNAYNLTHSDVENRHRTGGDLSSVFLPIDNSTTQAQTDSPSSSINRLSRGNDDRGGNSPDSSCYSYCNYSNTNSENNHNSEDNNQVNVRDGGDSSNYNDAQHHQGGPSYFTDINPAEDSVPSNNYTPGTGTGTGSNNCSPTASLSTRLDTRGHGGSSSHTGREMNMNTTANANSNGTGTGNGSNAIDTHRITGTGSGTGVTNYSIPLQLCSKDSVSYVSSMPGIDVALDVLTDCSSSCERSDYQSPASNMNHALALASAWGSPRPEVLHCTVLHCTVLYCTVLYCNTFMHLFITFIHLFIHNIHTFIHSYIHAYVHSCIHCNTFINSSHLSY